MGRRIVPFDISTAEITDKVLLEGLRQVYDFSIDLFSDMYAEPGKYSITDGISFSYLQNYLFQIGRSEQTRVIGNDWVINADDLPKGWLANTFELFNLFAPVGINYENKNGTITFRNSKYPLFPKYYSLLCAAALKRKVYCFDFVLFCDFRVFNKRISKKLDDLIRMLSDRDKAFALELHNHLLTKGVKPTPHGYCVWRYHYHNHFLMSINIPFASTQINFEVNLGRNPDDYIYKLVIEQVEKLTNKDELLAYIVDNVNYCRYCCSQKGDRSCGGYWAELVGEQRFLCPLFSLTKRGNKKGSKYYDSHEIDILKQFLDLRIKAIDSCRAGALPTPQ
jgi:hypothetical protein